MKLERAAEGLEARLRPSGVGRFFVAGFLTFWLCGWVVGEAFALFALATMVRAAIQGGVPPDGFGLGIAAALFLVVWLTLWTLGGVGAIREWLRLIASEDRIVAGPSGLRIDRRLGPFRTTREIGRDDLKRIYSVERRSRLLAETGDGATLEITALASREERRELEQALSRELGLDGTRAPVEASRILPKRWVETIDPEGRIAVLEDPAGRSRAAKVVWVIAVGLVAGAWALGSRSLREPAWGALAAMVSAAALLSTWGAWRLTTSRLEWSIGSGSVVLRRRARAGTTDLFAGTAIELQATSDSDGDTWYTLNAVAADGTGRRAIARTIHDPALPRQLGRWMAVKAGIPFDDQAEKTREGPDIAAALAQLEASGRLGRWVARRVRNVKRN